jgi:hypothetical protein
LLSSDIECWWMTCLSDLFGANEPTFFAFALNLHTHPTPEQKVGFQVSGGHTSPRNLGYWISGLHLNFAEKVRYQVSCVPRVQDPVHNNLRGDMRSRSLFCSFLSYCFLDRCQSIGTILIFIGTFCT